MQLSSESFKDGAVIPGEFAFCVPAREGHVALSTNLNPQLAWAGAGEAAVLDPAARREAEIERLADAVEVALDWTTLRRFIPVP